MKYIKYITLAAVVLASCVFTSCKDDEGGADVKMAVKAVYLEDASSSASNHDRQVEFARLGQLIRIEGSGFTGLKKIYINGYETYFNNALLTDNNVWVSLNSDTKIGSKAGDAANTIILYKNDGNQVTYPFTIRAAAPTITDIYNTLPKANEIDTVYGANLQEISSITLPSGTKLEAENCDEDGEWFTFVMPADETVGGSITAVGANGTAISPAYFNQNTCYIIDFDGLGTQGYWSWKETGSMCDNTDLVDDPLASGRGNVAMLVPNRLLNAGGIISKKSRATEWWTAGNGNDADDWTWMESEGGLFTAETPLTDIALQFDIYCPEVWNNTGQLQITLQNNVSFNGYGSDESKSSTTQTYVWTPWVKYSNSAKTYVAAGYQTDKWRTVTIPLSEFSKYANSIDDGETPVFQTVVDDRNNGSYKNFGFGFVNTDFTYEGVEFASGPFSTKIYLDNFRLVPCSSITVSDFDE